MQNVVQSCPQAVFSQFRLDMTVRIYDKEWEGEGGGERGIKGKGTEKLERRDRASSSAVVFCLMLCMLGWSHGESSQRPLLCSPLLVFSFPVSLSHTHHLASWKEVVSTGGIFLYLSLTLCLFPRERERFGRPQTLCVCMYSLTTHRQKRLTCTGTFIYYFMSRR